MLKIIKLLEKKKLNNLLINYNIILKIKKKINYLIQILKIKIMVKDKLISQMMYK